MSGTWLQESYYSSKGDLLIPTQLQEVAKPTTHQLLHAARSHPAVAAARTSSMSWVVMTSAYRKPSPTVMPPHSHAPLSQACWLAFVADTEAKTPGWTAVPLVLFPEYERNTNAVKTLAPLLFDPRASVFYLDFSLTRARCMSLPHLIRAPELSTMRLAAGATTSPSPYHLFASAIPSWSGRSSVPVQLDLTRAWIKKRADSRAEHALAGLEAAMRADVSPRFNSSNVEKRLIPDTLWMAWPAVNDGVAQELAKDWFDEVAQRCAYEKVSFAWKASKFPQLRKMLVNAVYIYEPSQRCQCSATTIPSSSPLLPQVGAAETLCRPQFPNASSRAGGSGTARRKRARGRSRKRSS